MIITVTMNPSLDKIYFINDYQLGEVHRATEMIASPGGKGLNVSRVAKLMGETVGATGPLGGSAGEFIRDGVKALGIENYFCPIDGESRTCINVTDSKNERCTEVLEAGPVISDFEAIAQLDIFDQILEHANVVTISGSMARGLPSDYYHQLIGRAKARNIPTLLDSSGVAFAQGIKAKPFAIKPNEDEILEVYGKPVHEMDEKVEAIRFFKKEGIELPIISLGKEGSLSGLSDGIYKVTIPKVEVINTVGSGDAFIAGLAIAIHRGLDEKSMLKMASACGTANTQYHQTGYVKVECVQKYFEEVTLMKIENY